MKIIQTRCCIAGGGPAGIMLGHLLARAGVDVVVLERHADFGGAARPGAVDGFRGRRPAFGGSVDERDVRGDTVHPSTLDVLDELGLLDDFLAFPHTELRELRARFGSHEVLLADFARTPSRCPFLVFTPQWRLLSLLAERAKAYPGFHLVTSTEVTGLVEDALVAGVRAQSPDGPIEIRADLVVGCDGRHSTVRGRAGLQVEEIASPIDVLWTRLPKLDGDPPQTLGTFDCGRLYVMLDRATHWQCGMVVRNGDLELIRSRGVGSLRDDLGRIAPFVRDRVNEIQSWDDVSVVRVRLDRLVRWWRPGLLCIGDAAHGMSPIGGVGINLAIQDAVAAANVLAEPLRNGTLGNAHLDAVQRRRMLPARVTQELQAFVQNRIWARWAPIRRGETGAMKPPPSVMMLERWPWLRGIPGRLIGLGVRPEHVHGSSAST